MFLTQFWMCYLSKVLDFGVVLESFFLKTVFAYFSIRKNY